MTAAASSSAKQTATSINTSRARSPNCRVWSRRRWQEQGGVLRLEQLRRADSTRKRAHGSYSSGLAGKHAQSMGRPDSASRRSRFAFVTGPDRIGLRTHLDGAGSGMLRPRRDRSEQSFAIRLTRSVSASARDLVLRSARLWRERPSSFAKLRRARKLFGGGMRQAGILAAAAIYAT